MTVPVYLDNASTTRTDPRVVERMLPYFTEDFGNAASRNHVFGWRAEEAVQWARQEVAQLVGSSEKEILFTSGATESNNLALKGLAHFEKRKGNHVVACVTEHKSVLDPLCRLEREGFRVTLLPVDRQGKIDLGRLEAELSDQTILVSIMIANNEIGTLQPVRAIGELCHRRGIVYHCDATQAVGKIAVDVERDQVDLLSLSAHKFYGPKGIGALYVRRRDPRVRLEPILDGGGHERGMRSGTLAVPSIVGLGAACAIARQEMDADARRTRQGRDRLHQGIASRIDGVTLNGHPEDRLPGLVNLSFAQVEGEALMMAMEDIAVSSGSACSSANPEPSYVLRALGIGDELAHSSLRFAVGRFNTDQEIDYAIDRVVQSVERLRGLSCVTRYAAPAVNPN